MVVTGLPRPLAQPFVLLRLRIHTYASPSLFFICACPTAYYVKATLTPLLCEMYVQQQRDEIALHWNPICRVSFDWRKRNGRNLRNEILFIPLFLLWKELCHFE